MGLGNECRASVLGSVLAIVIAIQFGLSVTLACGAAAYLLAVVLLPAFGRGGIRPAPDRCASIVPQNAIADFCMSDGIPKGRLAKQATSLVIITRLGD